MLRMFQNPMAGLQSMAQNNPDMLKVVDYINQHGGPEKAFYQLAKEKNADPAQVLSDVKNQVGGIF